MRREVKDLARKPPRANDANPSLLTPHPSLSGLSRSTLTRLAKLGIASQFDLVLHLPLRYDDETRLYTLGEAPPGQPVLVEGSVVECEIQYRPRRQLACHIEDGSGVLTLRFFNFYQSQMKQLAAGVRVRAFGEIRQGFRGPEMIHPRYRVVQEGLINALRHAQATNVDTEVKSDEQRIVVTVTDNGIGLPADWSRPGHFGLRGLAERVEHIGGSFTVSNSSSGGVKLKAEIPLGAAS